MEVSWKEGGIPDSSAYGIEVKGKILNIKNTVSSSSIVTWNDETFPKTSVEKIK